MAIQLTGEVGRSGRAEDVAVVQALLANIGGADGRPFWAAGIDGRAGHALAAAIEACQRFWGRALIDAGSSEKPGLVRPGSRTLGALQSLAPRGLDGLRVAATAPSVVLYAQDDPEGRAGRDRADARRAPGATLVSLSAIQQAQAGLLRRHRLSVTVRLSGLTGDRWGFRVGLGGLTVIEPDGRPRPADDRSGSVPTAIWRLVDDAFAGFFEVAGGGANDISGSGGYRSRTTLPSLRGAIDETLLVRMEVPRPARVETVRLAAAALGLIATARSLNQARQDELRQLIAMIAADDPVTARLLEERWRALRNGITRATLKYADNEQIREYLKAEGHYEAVLLLVGLGVLVSDAAFAAAEVASGVASSATAPATVLLALTDLLASGAENEAERQYQERLQAARSGGATIAGISVPKDVSRRDFLLGTFGIDLRRFRLDESAEGRLLELMERILELQRNRGTGASELREKIDREWGRYPFYERLLGVYRNALEAITNPVNAALRPDDRLAAYRRRVIAVKTVVDAVRGLAALRDVWDVRWKVRDWQEWGPLGGFLLWILEVENRQAIQTAKEELDRREAAL